MKVRRYTDADYPTVSKWWESWGWPVLPASSLPELGIIVENEVPICAAWIYRTDSDLCWIEWFISNKEATKEQRAGCVDELIRACSITAKEMGFRIAFVSVKQPNLMKRLEHSGFEKTDTNMTNFIGEL